MEMGFWKTLKKPVLALAPMANVTDAAFRRIIAKYGKPDVMFTEFVSADGLISEGREKLFVDLLYSESERPIVAQLFSGNPEKMFEAAKLVRDLGFDGLDINMGCPDRSIERSGAGAALMKDPTRAREILRAAREGLRGLPVSVKTRLGYNKDELETWLPALLAEEPVAITIHARTRKEMSKVPAHWDRILDAVRLRDSFGSNTFILGNGDVASIAEAKQKAEQTGADGIMLGRAIFGNPWLFANLAPPEADCQTEHPPKRYAKADRSSLPERLEVMMEHTKLFEELLGKHKNFAIMKKHFKAYIEGFSGAKELRVKLMETENAEQVEKIVGDFLPAQAGIQSFLAPRFRGDAQKT